MKKIYILSGLLSLVYWLVTAGSAFAQHTMKGTITDAITHEPLIGATIRIREDASAGTVTDVSGQYVLSTSKELPITLQVGYVGYEPQEIDVYEINDAFNIALHTSQVLNEIVVTAVGIERSAKSLTYSLAEVKGNDLVKAREPNVVAALGGKVAGVQINNSGGSPGGSSSIRIRGNASLLGNNLPLFILDGVPIDNSTQDILTNITNGNSLATPSNRGIDINSADVESITILKGPAAAALYGIRAANGAVILNTKRGSKLTEKSMQVSMNAAFTVEDLNRRVQPRQNKYSNGLNGAYILPGLPGSDENWGALLDTLTYSTLPSSFDKNGQIVSENDPNSNGIPVNQYDNIDNFFVKGKTQTYDLNIYGNTGKAGYYASVGRLYQTGIIPTTNFYRTTVRFNADYQVTDRLKIAAGINYINSGTDNRALMGGFNTNVIRALINTPSNFDITNGYDEPWKHSESYMLPATNAKPWGDSRSYANGRGWDNPYWSLKMNPQYDEVNRWINFIEGNYEVLPWLTTTFRYGSDQYSDVRKGAFSRGTSGVATGTINDVIYTRRDLNTDFLVAIDPVLPGDFGMNVILGHNFYNSYRNQINTRGDGLVVPGDFNIANASTTITFNQEIRRRLVAGYADIKLNYKTWLFLELTGRNEWTSTLPKGKNSLFYPSVGGSFIFTEALATKSNLISSGKIRATYAEVGNDADPYSLETYYNNTSAGGWIQGGITFPFNNQSGLSYGSNVSGQSGVLGNPELKPERIRSWEVGAELGLFKNRINVDAVYYDNLSRDQIIPVAIPVSTGAAYNLINAGKVSNKGIELSLGFTPWESQDFTWNTNLIYSKNISKVLALAPGVENVSLGGIWMEARGMVGEPYGVFYGTDVAKNDQGQVLIDDNPDSPYYGYPVVNTSVSKIGDPNPDGNFGLRNEINYKNLTLSFFFDARYGFDIFNAPKLQMVFNGVDKSTENRGEEYVFEGVKASEGGGINDIPVEIGQDWYRRTFDIQGLYIEKNLYWIKLRDVNLTYRLPEKLISPLKLSSASFTLTARNFLLATNYSGSDPDLGTRNGLSNFSGIDFWTTPNTRSFGAAINVVF